jgi:hypothetical protein
VKIAASKKKGMWMGGNMPLGYMRSERTLVIDRRRRDRAPHLRALSRIRLRPPGQEEADRLGLKTKRSTTVSGTERGGKPFSRGHLYGLLSNPIYVGQIAHGANSTPASIRR